MANWMTRALYTIAPGRCILCDARSGRHLDLCIDCEHDLPFIANACVRCGMSLTHPHGICVSCMVEPPPWDDCLIPLLYVSPVDRLIGDFKNRGAILVGRILATIVADGLEDRRDCARPDTLIPVPLHSETHRARGFNQSMEIARVISRRCNISATDRLCRRIHHAAPQKSLPAAERRRNLRGAFQAVGDVTGAHIAIVDDVVTTGTTAAELARVLFSAGAVRVSVIAIARTPL